MAKKEIDPASRVKYATPAQVRYLDGLLIDIGLSNLVPRNAYLSRETNRDIQHIDQLTKMEASRLIDELKERKDRNKAAAKAEKRDPYADPYGDDDDE
jgi:hypothetical protein